MKRGLKNNSVSIGSNLKVWSPPGKKCHEVLINVMMKYRSVFISLSDMSELAAFRSARTASGSKMQPVLMRPDKVDAPADGKSFSPSPAAAPPSRAPAVPDELRAQMAWLTKAAAGENGCCFVMNAMVWPQNS